MEVLAYAFIEFGVIYLLMLKGRSQRGPSRTGTSKRQPAEPKPVKVSPRPVYDAAAVRPVPENTTITGRAWVTDGDTITINKVQIRLFGIDAPELDHPYGQKAKWAMVKLCKGQTVRAEILADDRFGRTVAKCFLEDGRDLSAELVKQGLAIDWPKFSGGVYTALEVPGVRKKLWLADARQKGRAHIWETFDYDAFRQKKRGG